MDGVLVAEVESLKENQSDAAIHDAHHLAYHQKQAQRFIGI
jgi:hypothetical protein